jgi:hypothetical protein
MNIERFEHRIPRRVRGEGYCGATSVVGAGNVAAVGAGSGAREHTD